MVDDYKALMVLVPKKYIRHQVPLDQLRPGDLVFLADSDGTLRLDGFNLMLVWKVEDGKVTFVRPWAYTREKTWVGGHWLEAGQEIFEALFAQDHLRYIVIRSEQAFSPQAVPGRFSVEDEDLPDGIQD